MSDTERAPLEFLSFPVMQKMRLSDLQHAETAQEFRSEFVSSMDNSAAQLDLDEPNSKVNVAFAHAASHTLGTQPLKPHKPWISQRTLDIIRDRNFAIKAEWGF